MSIQGIVSLSYDTRIKTGIGPANSPWLADLAALSPAPHHLLIRTRVIADNTDNSIDLPAFIADLEAYKASGYSVYLVFDRGSDVYDQMLNPVHQPPNLPNAALGGPEVGGDKLLNPYINHFSMRVLQVCKALEGLIAGIFLWNEPNLDGNDLTGGGGTGAKPSALSPANFAALVYSTTKRLRDPVAGVPWLTTIFPGSLSCLVGFNTDARGPWIGGYMSAGIAYLRSVGALEPFAWNGVSLNVEGAVTEAYMAYSAGAISDLKNHWGVTGPLVIGEWGTANGVPGSLNAGVLNASFAAINKHTDLMFFFAHHALIPGDLTSYGCRDYSEQNGQFLPTTALPWGALLTAQLASLYQ